MYVRLGPKREGKMDNSVLTFREYNIAGNVLRAYYDADGKLVFVLDSTLDGRKPNTLLVINPVGDRKWDDILANDYGVDLETVRPKKNNKYQKLDIEYSGLAEYDNLINAYVSGADLTEALAALAEFREESVRRAAQERLAVAESDADRARETISRTKNSIDELQIKLRALRSKLAQQKKQVGREPTKKSASKILRTDAQIDATNEKLRRAKKRLANAQRRLIVADEDAEIARKILARDADKSDARDNNVASGAVTDGVVTTYNISYDDMMDDADNASDANSDVVDEDIHFTTEFVGKTRVGNVAAGARSDDKVAREPVDMDGNVPDETFIENKDTDEPKAEIMADENKNESVRPLFDTEPEVLDENIAFKPIEFGVSSPVEKNDASDSDENAKVYDNIIDDKPLSFTPPTPRVDNVRAQPENDSVGQSDEKHPAPVLDTLTAVDVPQAQNQNATSARLDSELTTGMADAANVEQGNATPTTNIPMTDAENAASGAGMNSDALNTEPKINDNVARPVPPAATLAAASTAAAARPVSPITGTGAPTNPAPRKPTFVYYLLLVLLIGLSVFTLWLYQKNTSDKVPDLTATVPAVEMPVATSDTDIDGPFLPVVEEEPVAIDESEPVPSPEPQPAASTEPVTESVVAPEPEPEPVVVPEPEPVADVVVESINVVTPEPEPEPVIETEEEILASKPAYNVSQNENMFVADPEYDTETLRQDNLPVVNTSGGTVVTTNINTDSGNNTNTVTDEYVPQAVTSVVWEQPAANLPMCPDGTAPDVNGCCPGEVYTDMGDQGFNCCPADGGDCFPPLI